MERKRKIRRAFLLAVCIYIIINMFIFGLMKAYLNTNNTASRNQIVMASVSQNTEKTEIEILGKNFSINKNQKAEKIAETVLYLFMPYKIRACTEIVIKCENTFSKNFKNT